MNNTPKITTTVTTTTMMTWQFCTAISLSSSISESNYSIKVNNKSYSKTLIKIKYFKCDNTNCNNNYNNVMAVHNSNIDFISGYKYWH
jgi:hypothetical protein